MQIELESLDEIIIYNCQEKHWWRHWNLAYVLLISVLENVSTSPQRAFPFYMLWKMWIQLRYMHKAEGLISTGPSSGPLASPRDYQIQETEDV